MIPNEPHTSSERRVVGGIPVDSVPQEKLLRRRFARTEADPPALVMTPNLAMAADLLRHPENRTLFSDADVLLPDGCGIRLLGRLTGIALPTANGIDFAERLLEEAARRREPVYFLGGKPRVAYDAAANKGAELTGLQVAGCHHGYFDKTPGCKENENVIREINASGARLVFVCFGYPLQETWMAQNRARLPGVRLCIGLGGSFDVWSGDLPRAPKLFRAARLEWLWRTVHEPRRVRGVAGMLAALPHLWWISLRQNGIVRSSERQNARKLQKIEAKSMQSDNLVKK